MNIRKALPTEARQIARLIMVAMNYECCQFFAGEAHTLTDFEDLMTVLVERTDSQYSYTNTLVASPDASEAMGEASVAGICVSYDGAALHRLRTTFIEEAKVRFGRDFSGMDDETQAGELYIDSLCVSPAHRGQGLASHLIAATIDKARTMGLPAVGLLVDKGNPAAERLYLRLGFVYQGDACWGGHPMRHLQYHI